MKKCILLLFVFFLSLKLLGQENRKYPLPLREISGIVKDSTGVTLAGATIFVYTSTDTLKGVTNDDGIFIFKKVTSSTFLITVKSLGYKDLTLRLYYNDQAQKIVLEPIILGIKPNMLSDVEIKGTPSITYKTDTIEYRASDYKVKDNANVDDLLRKMEGMEIARDGKLFHQGQEVTRARLNGKDYIGGEVTSAIQGLPADIIEKVQIVDDYGDMAARTGIKDSSPEKVLNLTTRADRSIGNTVRTEAGIGNNNRYDAKVLATRINANRVLAVNGNFNNTLNGIAGNENRNAANASGTTISPGVGAVSGGISKVINPSFSLRDTWGKKLEVNFNYTFFYKNSTGLNNSSGQLFSSAGTTNFQTIGENKSLARVHNFSFDLEYNVDKYNYFRVKPTIIYSSGKSPEENSILQTGLIHQQQRLQNLTTNTVPNFGGSIFFQHLFEKKGRNYSIQLSSTASEVKTANSQLSNIIYFDGSTDLVLKDSLVQRFISNRNLNGNYKVNFVYNEPLSSRTMLQISAQSGFRLYDNSKSVMDLAGKGNTLDSLTNAFKYAFNENRLAVILRLSLKKYSLSLGVTGILSRLYGTGETQGEDTDKKGLNLIPVARVQYQWSKQHQIQINYSGNPVEPAYTQLQPVRDVSNPQNSVVGNPNLKIAFRHSLALNYNNYMANSRLSYFLNLSANLTRNQIVTNTTLITDAYNSLKYETRFLNMNGNYIFNANYGVSKQISDGAYNLSLNGSVGNVHSVAMSNNLKSITSTWRYNLRFGPRISPKDFLEINPFFAYDLVNSVNSLPQALPSRTQMLSVNLDGKAYLPKNFVLGYALGKNFVSGINNNISNNPFIVNLYAEMQFLKRKNATLRLQVFDLLNENNFISRVITENSVIDTKTNALSRYVMLTFKLNLQKWSGTPMRNGEALKRRGDGSFIQ